MPVTREGPVYVPVPGRSWKDRHDWKNYYLSFSFSSPFKALAQNIIEDGIHFSLNEKKIVLVIWEESCQKRNWSLSNTQQSSS